MWIQNQGWEGGLAEGQKKKDLMNFDDKMARKRSNLKLSKWLNNHECSQNTRYETERAKRAVQ